MNLLSKIFGIGAKSVAEGVTDVAEKAADIVERWKPGDEKKTAMFIDVQAALTAATNAARAYDPRSEGGGIFGQIVNVIVDAVSRAVRPGVTIMLLGGIFGWWTLDVSTQSPIVLGWGETVIVFWFGGRVLFKDLPSLIAFLRRK